MRVLDGALLRHCPRNRRGRGALFLGRYRVEHIDQVNAGLFQIDLIALVGGGDDLQLFDDIAFQRAVAGDDVGQRFSTRVERA